MTEMDKANIRLLILNFAQLWNDLEETSDWCVQEVDNNIKHICGLVNTDPKMLGWV